MRHDSDGEDGEFFFLPKKICRLEMVTLVTGFKPIDCPKGKGLISISKAWQRNVWRRGHGLGVSGLQ